jgi:hypothetical protein
VADVDSVRFVIEPGREITAPWAIDFPQEPAAVVKMLVGNENVQEFAAQSEQAAHEMISELRTELAQADDLACFLASHGVATHQIRRLTGPDHRTRNRPATRDRMRSYRVFQWCLLGLFLLLALFSASIHNPSATGLGMVGAAAAGVRLWASSRKQA